MKLKSFYQVAILVVLSIFITVVATADVASKGPIFVVTIDGPINPATNDFLKTSIESASSKNARLYVVNGKLDREILGQPDRAEKFCGRIIRNLNISPIRSSHNHLLTTYYSKC